LLHCDIVVGFVIIIDSLVTIDKAMVNAVRIILILLQSIPFLEVS
jgi:hypothetical protein